MSSVDIRHWIAQNMCKAHLGKAFYVCCHKADTEETCMMVVEDVVITRKLYLALIHLTSF